MKPSFSTISLLLLLPISLLALIFLFVYPNDLRLQKTLTSSCHPTTTTTTTSTSSTSSLNFSGLPSSPAGPAFSLLLGILTWPTNYERRYLLRSLYSLQQLSLQNSTATTTNALIDIKFVLCKINDDETRTLIALEILRYDDIIILNCTENMNKGKTYTYFSSLPSILSDGPRTYDYVMKADDDAYFRLPNLIESLTSQPKTDYYYGAILPCDGKDVQSAYFSGLGYLLSWDLVTWMSTSEIPKEMKEGDEDLIVGAWLRKGGKGKNRKNARPAMYDYQLPGVFHPCLHEFRPDTIAVHRLKDRDKWARTLRYFNVTVGLKPSKLHFNL